MIGSPTVAADWYKVSQMLWQRCDHQTGTAGLSAASAFFILMKASCIVSREAAYEMRMQLSSPNASPGTNATYTE